MAVAHPRLDDDPRAVEPSLGHLARGVWHRAVVVLGVVVVTVAVALVVTAQSSRTYEASAEVRVSSGNLPSADGMSSAEANTLLATQVQYLQSSQLANDVAQRLAGEFDVIQVLVEGVPESQVATITVVSSSAEGAARAANTYAVAYDERRDAAVVEEATARAQQTEGQVERLQARLEELQAQIDEETERVNGEIARITIARDAAARVGTVLEPSDVIQPNTSFLNALQGQYSDTASQLGLATTRLEEYRQVAQAANGGVAIVSAAEPPAAPSSPGAAQVVALAGILGLALGVGLALLLTALDRRLRSARDVAAVAGPLDTVGPAVGRPDPAALTVDGMSLPPLTGRTVDSFLAPALWLAQAVEGSGRNRVLVTSPREPQSAAPALAVALARCGRSVVLVDADLRNHGPAVLDPTRRRGLSDVLLGEVLLVDVLVDVEVPGSGSLRIVSAGREEADLAALGSSEMGRLLEVLGRDADVVVVSGAPCRVGRELDIAPVGVDASLLLVTLGATVRDDLDLAVAHVQRAGAPALGVLVVDPDLRGTGHGAVPGRRRAASDSSSVPSGSSAG
ncbi:Wzz/FepE/Etk N-terminal domain-containing protein [Aquipuribacter sp. SD81]|uniref:Wzz/FepE/Etk N-terminal domain-containing protein n=1 Tax=Aquipuribacter sp. SD81 TaxID=3127703 RepID=UPI003019A841